MLGSLRFEKFFFEKCHSGAEKRPPPGIRFSPGIELYAIVKELAGWAAAGFKSGQHHLPYARSIHDGKTGPGAGAWVRGVLSAKISWDGA
jgi:hypothetical protein